MRAYLLREAKSAQIGDVPEPSNSPEEVLVHMRTLSVCETDSKVIDGALKTRKLPIILGHEGGGVIEKVGRQVGELVEGDRVLVDPNIYDYTCHACRKGLYQLCENGGLMGREADGLFSERIAINPRNLYQVPGIVEEEIIPLIQPLSTVIHAVRKVEIFPQDVVAVMGLGPSGLLISSVAKCRGAIVIGVSRTKKKLELSKAFGVDHALNALEQDIASEAREITDGRGVDVAIEAAGVPQLLRLCVDIVRPGGSVLQFGFSNSDASYNMYTLYEKEVKLIGARSSIPSDFLAAIRLVASGQVKLNKLVTAKFRFDDMGNAVKASTEKSENLKVTVTV